MGMSVLVLMSHYIDCRMSQNGPTLLFHRVETHCDGNPNRDKHFCDALVILRTSLF